MREARDTEGGETDEADERSGGAQRGASRSRRALALLGSGASRLLVVASLLGLVVGGGWLVTRAATPPQGPTTSTIPGLDIKAARVAPGSQAPAEAAPAGGRAPAGASHASGAAEDSAHPEQSQQRSTEDMLSSWAEQAEPEVGVPARALVAYGKAELAMRTAQPDCRISWATLAGIGRIESNHSRYAGAVLQPDGYPSKPIIGVPLDGSPGVDSIADTDNGAYDGDPDRDRAIGPMQFIPSTWARYASDGNNDGAGNPQQIDDAALAAARYLCADGRDLGTPSGWWHGVLSYNHAVEYAKKVFTVAETYAKRAQGVTAS